MGRPIVYCGMCGKSLKEDDFSKGRAHVIDNASFCVTCRIVPQPIQAPPRPAPLPTSTPKPIPAPKPLPSSTPRHHTAAPAHPPSSSASTVIGVTVAIVLAVVALAVLLLNSGSTSAPTPSPPPAPPRRGAEPRSVPDEAARAAIQNLEAFASASADPDVVLERCQATRSTLRGTPYQTRLEAVEARALEARAARDRDRQLGALVESVRRTQELDPQFARRQEIVKMLQGALPTAGPRRTEIEKLLAEYQKAADDFAAKPRDLPPPPPPPKTPAPATLPSGLSGPYDLEENGAVSEWLVLGPFPCRADRGALYDADLLKTEAAHMPSAGMDVATSKGLKVAWTPVSAAGGTVLFRNVPAVAALLKPQEPAIAYAACWLSAEKDVEARIRIVADQGVMVWVDHRMFWSEANAKGLGGEEVVMQLPLAEGAHLLLFKIVTTGPDFGFRLRATTEPGGRLPGVRVWSQKTAARKILFSENFNQGRGNFIGGDVVPGGVDGTMAMAVPHKSTQLGIALPDVAEPTWTLRVKMKPLVPMKAIEITIWSNKSRANFRYHVRGLKANEWNLLEVKASQLNQKWEGGGKTFEGETVNDLRIYFDDPVPDGSLLIDDVEISQ